MSPDIAASVRARLLRKAKLSGEEFEFTLVRYACERFLYRLGASPLREQCILKGASLHSVWMKDPYRATRDIDLLSHGPSDDLAVRQAVSVICSVPCHEDGLIFDLDTLEVTPIRSEQEYDGRRAVLVTRLGNARIRLQVDFGFGDALTLEPDDVEYPILLEQTPVPRVRAYHIETSLAEKFETMVQLGRRNSRMKDFHDIWLWSSTIEFNGQVLQAAIAACFDRRRTLFNAELPDALTPAFYSDPDMQARWASYVREGAFNTAPEPGFDSIGNRIREFLAPIRASIIAGQAFCLCWSPLAQWMTCPPRSEEE